MSEFMLSRNMGAPRRCTKGSPPWAVGPAAGAGIFGFATGMEYCAATGVKFGTEAGTEYGAAAGAGFGVGAGTGLAR